MDEASFPYPHNTDPDIFREALSYSEAVTGFTSTLIEKDYYCSLILQHFFGGDTPLVFKGGTCLSKVYADFYRPCNGNDGGICRKSPGRPHQEGTRDPGFIRPVPCCQ